MFIRLESNHTYVIVKEAIIYTLHQLILSLKHVIIFLSPDIQIFFFKH
jgi:hypothetical protein